MNHNTVERASEVYFISTSAKMWFPCGIQESLDQYTIDTWHDPREKRTLYGRLMMKIVSIHIYVPSQRVNNCQAGIVHLVHCPLNYSYSEGLKMTH